mmetsp:Transcript_486/g.948  ORF Transcript_486/g.948 Transcript_486/m.948 type:complete len:697 (+) Transcript_486:178-2268(+)|eukprot:CAMPEP_0183731226 /NCGR_PEP_ID=MMETSP0737-20130205/34787_1 /TAXON_ID=385413 /ORGANISM="Thalassiosira miniscula, Strain CCMP1093" /LENGTH=696 /DNA_ID=CAMNT_0025963913 /DNA_START=96 /DNA_END=2186 /DNA_ORIENTATION=-
MEHIEACTSQSQPHGSDDGASQQLEDGVLIHLESDTTRARGEDNDAGVPQPWSEEFVQKIEKKHLKLVISSGNVPPVTDICLHMVRGTLERISNKSKKKIGSAISMKPTPIQLRMWPALLHSLEMKVRAKTASVSNVVGIAPTGSGKTMAYATPIVSNCLRILLCQKAQALPAENSSVHGLVLVPTRELAIQVSKEFKVASKVANKYLSKCTLVERDATNRSMKVEPLAVYGGVDIDSQVASILGKEDPSVMKSLVVAATAGRLLDILKQSASNEGTVVSAFSNLQVIVFDEADRIAVNADMAGQVDEIISILDSEKKRTHQKRFGLIPNKGMGVLSCLVSATLPEKAKQMCEKWVPRQRIVIKIDSMRVREKKYMKLNKPTDQGGKGNDGGGGDTYSHKESSPGMQADECKKGNNLHQNLDLASIPSNIVQTLHVCSNHKKPKKLILTLQRIYLRKDAQSSGRFTTNNRLCIVFFAQIKTVKYASKLLEKEGLRCVELYGSLSQSERDRRLLEFKAGKTPILLATDVAARGLHIPNVNFVVNYDFPGTLDQYVHRCGRAGRKQQNGENSIMYPPTVYSFFNRELKAMADSVVELLKACNAWVDPNLLALTSEKKNNKKKKASSNEESSNNNNNKKTSGKKRKRKTTAKRENQTGEEKDDESDNDNEFSFLGRSSSALKRASHVSDAEDSDDDDDE